MPLRRRFYTLLISTSLLALAANAGDERSDGSTPVTLKAPLSCTATATSTASCAVVDTLHATVVVEVHAGDVHGVPPNHTFTSSTTAAGGMAK